jgi:hypothetical protein
VTGAALKDRVAIVFGSATGIGELVNWCGSRVETGHGVFFGSTDNVCTYDDTLVAYSGLAMSRAAFGRCSRRAMTRGNLGAGREPGTDLLSHGDDQRPSSTAARGQSPASTRSAWPCSAASPRTPFRLDLRSVSMPGSRRVGRTTGSAGRLTCLQPTQ